MERLTTFIIGVAMYFAMFVITVGIGVILTGAKKDDTESAAVLSLIISLTAADILAVILMVQNGVLQW